MNNLENSVFGTNGMGIYLLQEVLNKDIDNTATFGYSNSFIGAAVYLNSGLRKRNTTTNERLEGIQGVTSDGSSNINTWDIPNDDTCYFNFRSDDPKHERGDDYQTIRIHYKQDMLDVLFYDKKINQFEHCFNLDIKFTSGSYLALSSSSGIWDEDYHIVKSIKTMDPNKIDKSHTEERAKLKRGEKFVESFKSSEDVMHSNRLQYTDSADLIRKVNHELRTFSLQSQALNNMIMMMKNIEGINQDTQVHTIDLERLHTDIDKILADFFILEKMLR